MFEQEFKPYIVCAATKMMIGDKEIIVTSPRHHDKVSHRILEHLTLNCKAKELGQGFVDQYGNFYTREAAWIVAEQNKQIKHRRGGDTYLNKETGLYIGRLFSENLY